MLATVLEGQIERRALANAEQLARVTAQVGVAPRLVPRDLQTPMSQLRLSQLDTDLRQSGLEAVGLERVKIFNARGDLVYSDDRKLIGRNDIGSDNLREALGGGLVSEIEHGMDDNGRGRQLLEVYTPLSLGSGVGVDGALEIYLSYDAVAAAIGREKRTLYLLLGIGLALLYAVLFRIVARASRRLRHLALHDALTGLPNRTLFHERVERAIKGMRPERTVAVLLVDLDRFKEVNDTLGHDHGDELLKVVAERLSGALRDGDTLARLGGDEFAVVLTDLPHRGAAAETAGRLHDALRRPFGLRGIAVELDASVGVALAPEHGRDVTTLIQRADVAMYDAKRTQARVATYSTERDPYSPARLSLLGELRRAIEGDELVLHYQPKVSLDGDRVTGVEALVRWQHPEHGLLQPDQFVPLAERTGTIAHLTRWVLDAALRQCAEWRLEYPDLTVAVNLAAANVLDVGLPAMVTELLDEHGLPGSALECEVSEHTVMSDPQRVTEVLVGAARARRPPLARRLRDRPGLARLSQAAADRRGQDRPRLRHLDGRRRRRRRDRPLDDRPRSQPRPRRGRRGCRVRERPGGAGRPALQQRPGLSPRPPAALRRARPLAQQPLHHPAHERERPRPEAATAGRTRCAGTGRPGRRASSRAGPRARTRGGRSCPCRRP